MKKICFVLALALLLSNGIPLCYNMYDKVVGTKLVVNLYAFTVETAKEQDAALEKILTEELYNQYTIGSDQRQLRVYLKYMNKDTQVNIIDHEVGKIIYSLNHPDIDSSRTFMLEYDHNFLKVTAISEAELFFLPPSGRGYYE